jgi:hypothetical protein
MNHIFCPNFTIPQAAEIAAETGQELDSMAPHDSLKLDGRILLGFDVNGGISRATQKTLRPSV